MSEFLNETHFEDLKACDPRDVVDRTGCQYDAQKGQYRLNVWGYDYCIDLKQQAIFPVTDGLKTYQDFLYLFIVFYLIKARKKKPSGQWISEKDIPGGSGFFRGPHTLPLNAVTERVKNDLQLFETICIKLGGRPINFADRAYLFQITPMIPVAVLYWQGDEDFPSEAKLLFDQTIEAHLPLDIVFALAVEVCHAFANK